MMQPAAELHRVLAGTSTRHMLHCCGALGRSSRPSPAPLFPYPFSLGTATRRAPFEAREINVRLVARRFSGSSATNHRGTDAAAAALGSKKRTRRASGSTLGHNGRERERGSYCENVPHCYRPSSSFLAPSGSPSLDRRRRRLVLQVLPLVPLVLALQPVRHFARLHLKIRRCKINVI